MIFARAIREIYPEAIANVDFVIFTDETKPYNQDITYWNDEKFKKPTLEELEAAWIIAAEKLNAPKAPTETELLKQENAELKVKLENVGSRLESVEMATITLMDFM